MPAHLSIRGQARAHGRDRHAGLDRRAGRGRPVAGSKPASVGGHHGWIKRGLIYQVQGDARRVSSPTHMRPAWHRCRALANHLRRPPPQRQVGDALPILPRHPLRRRLTGLQHRIEFAAGAPSLPRGAQAQRVGETAIGKAVEADAGRLGEQKGRDRLAVIPSTRPAFLTREVRDDRLPFAVG